MTRNLIVIICCCLFTARAAAQEDTAREWRHYQLDELVGISFPGEMPKDMNWADSSYGFGDSTYHLSATIVDLSEEIAAMGPMKVTDLTELVYKTQIERMEKCSHQPVEHKVWRWKKHNFIMMAWYPASNTEAQFYGRIRTYPWGPDIDTRIYPYSLQYERMLFYNNKLYVFSMSTVSVAYHDRQYFMRGGRPVKELLALKEKFFRSIEVKKLPRNK